MYLSAIPIKLPTVFTNSNNRQDTKMNSFPLIEPKERNCTNVVTVTKAYEDITWSCRLPILGFVGVWSKQNPAFNMHEKLKWLANNVVLALCIRRESSLTKFLSILICGGMYMPSTTMLPPVFSLRPVVSQRVWHQCHTRLGAPNCYGGQLKERKYQIILKVVNFFFLIRFCKQISNATYHV